MTTCGQCREHFFVEFVHRDHDDADRGIRGLDLARDGDAVLSGQPDVDDGNVRLLAQNRRRTLDAVGAFRDHVATAGFECSAQSCAGQRMIFEQDDADRRVHRPAGALIVKVLPCGTRGA